MVRRQRLFAQVCEVWCRGSLTPFEESSAYHLSFASFHWEEMWPMKKFSTQLHILVVEGLVDGVLDRVIRGPIKSWGGTCKIGADRSN